MGKIAFVYPGQGTQFPGMGYDIYKNSEFAKNLFDSIFSELNFDFKKIMFESSESEIKETINAQPSIVTMSLVLTELLKEKGIKPDFVAGHSIGEYSAFGAANYLSVIDTVKLARIRGEIMNEVNNKVNGSMAAILGMDADKIIEILSNIDGIVEAVNFNEPNQTVISGEDEAVTIACEELKKNGAKRAIKLQVSGPFHSSLMLEAGEKLRKEAEKFDFKMTDIKIVANTTAKIINTVDELRDEIYRQSFGPVRWVETILELKKKEVKKIYEIGPGKVLGGLIKKIDKEIEIINIEKLEDF